MNILCKLLGHKFKENHVHSMCHATRWCTRKGCDRIEEKAFALVWCHNSLMKIDEAKEESEEEQESECQQ